MAVGEFIEHFPFPVCNAFTSIIIDGQMCYTFKPNTSMANKTTVDKPYLMFILDYNEDNEYGVSHRFVNDNGNKTLKRMEGNHDRMNEAMIYIHTLGNYLFFICKIQFFLIPFHFC